MSTTLQPSHAPIATRSDVTPRAWSVPLLRSAAIVYTLFTLGHTLGGMLGDTHRGARQIEVFSAMRAYTFEVQGVTRSYWDFYRGFGFTTSVLLALAAVLCWVLAGIGRTHPREARRVLVPFTVAMAAVTWLAFVDFFGGPMVFSALALALLTAALIALTREATQHTAQQGTSR